MSVLDFFSRLEKLGIGIDLSGDNLKINAPKGTLTQALLKELKEKKTEIIRFLQEHIQQPQKLSLIEPVEKRDYYRLSSAQKRLFVLQQLDPRGTAYNIPDFFVITGEFDRQKIEQALIRLIARHESLRTSFIEIAGQPVQRIHNPGDIEFQIEYIEAGSREQVAEFIRPFDLSCAPLMRAGLIEQDDLDTILIIDIHHIISDGTSSNVFVRDFIAVYENAEMLPLQIQYKDFSRWQNSNRETEAIKKQEIYWLEQFADQIPVLNLPTDFPRPVVKSFAGGDVKFEIDAEETAAIEAFVLEHNVTLYMFLFSVYTILLAKLSCREDMVVGTPTAGRMQPNLEPVIGMFVNTLCIRSFPGGEKRFIELLQEMKRDILTAFAKQDFQFEELVEKLGLKRDTGRNPLFDVMFVLQNLGAEEVKVPGLTLKTYNHETRLSKFDLTLMGFETGKALKLRFEYSSKLFKQETIETYATYFRKILLDVLGNPGIVLGEIELLSDEEKRKIIFDFNHTEVEYPHNKTIHHLFAEQAIKTPGQIAVVAPSGSDLPDSTVPVSLTYRELNLESGRLAARLIEYGIETDQIVGIVVERSLEMIIGILSILKAGAAYLPIDPLYPPERKAFMLQDSHARLLLTTRGLNKDVENLHSSEIETFFIEAGIRVGARRAVPSEQELRGEPCVPPIACLENGKYPRRAVPNSIAYVIYTSGSTGKPKGVLVEHGNAVNVVTWFGRKYRLKPGFKVLQMSDYTFDASVNQFFGTLLHGAELHIITKNILLDIEALRNYIKAKKINLVNFVPLLMKELLCCEDTLESLKVVLVGGEKLDENTKDGILAKGYRLYNQYGPTETTIDALVSECSDSRVNLGRPIDNLQCYIVDRYFKLQPIGVTGELVVSGAGVARGYLNRPELTAERFIDNASVDKSFLGVQGAIFQKSPLVAEGMKLYKTGDLCRWLPDDPQAGGAAKAASGGVIEFLGRIDHQVKIRGFRIELGEIENRILQHEKVKEAVVIAREDDRKEKYLCAYITVIPGDKKTSEIDVGARRAVPDGIENHEESLLPELREYLSHTLPGHMIPAHFITMDSIPLTLNGKVDKKALPQPELQTGERYVAPRDEVEKKLAAVWSDILNKDPENISIDDDFFQSGGHSLKATLMTARIYKEIQVRIPLAEIFTNSTIRNLAKFIKSISKGTYVSIPRVEKKEYYLPSSQQRRLYILQQMSSDSTGYNISKVVVLKGQLDKNLLERTFRELVKRHEGLRTSFKMIAGQLVQRIRDAQDVDFTIEYVETEVEQFIRSFDLAAAPLFRIGLIRESDKRHVLIMDMHHIVTDGTSMGVLIKDFMAIYAGTELNPLRLQYKDYSEWMNGLIEREDEIVRREREYWLKQFGNHIPRLNLPLDYERSEEHSFAGGVVEFEIAEDETKALKELAGNEEVTLYMVLLGIFNILLYTLCAPEEVVIGTVVAGRRHTDLLPVNGMFVNTMALKNSPSGEKTFREFLREVKRCTLGAFENQGYQFEDLVEAVEQERFSARNPVFDVMFVLQNLDFPRIEIPGLTLQPYEQEILNAKFDLSLNGVEKDDKLFFSFSYKSKLFREETVAKFGNYFKEITSAVLKDRDIRIEEIDISTRFVNPESSILSEASEDFGFM